MRIKVKSVDEKCAYDLKEVEVKDGVDLDAVVMTNVYVDGAEHDVKMKLLLEIYLKWATGRLVNSPSEVEDVKNNRQVSMID